MDSTHHNRLLPSPVTNISLGNRKLMRTFRGITSKTDVEIL